MSTRCTLAALLLTLAPSFAQAMPSALDLRVSGLLLVDEAQVALRQVTRGEAGFVLGGESRGSGGARERVGLDLVGWLLSAGVYGVCLTAGVSELVAGDPAMAVENLSRSLGQISIPATAVPGWAGSIARAVGVVSLALGGEEGAARSASRLELMLLPIGPERAAGFSISGCFR